MKTSLTAIGLICLTLYASHANAIEPMSASALNDICANAVEQPETDDAWLCVVYVKGFLDGAVATDGRVAENVASEIDGDESYSERAIRTRVINRLRDFGPSVYADFCVGQPDPIVEVVAHVVEELERYDDLTGIQAQTIVYDSLRRHYPCVVPADAG